MIKYKLEKINIIKKMAKVKKPKFRKGDKVIVVGFDPLNGIIGEVKKVECIGKNTYTKRYKYWVYARKFEHPYLKGLDNIRAFNEHEIVLYE